MFVEGSAGRSRKSMHEHCAWLKLRAENNEDAVNLARLFSAIYKHGVPAILDALPEPAQEEA